MAIHFDDLPIDLFSEPLQPHIARFNVQMRDIFGLEGTLLDPRKTQRSDATVARREEIQVDTTRVSDSGSPSGGVSIGTAIPVSVGTTAASAGSSADAAADDHRHALNQAELITFGDGEWLRRDGGNTITGDILPDGDETRSIGSASAHIRDFYVRDMRFSDPVGFGLQRFTFLDSGSSEVTSMAIGDGSIIIGTAPEPNSWQATAFTSKLMAIEDITTLDELGSPAAGDYAMGSNKLTGLAVGTTSGDAMAFGLNSLDDLAAAGATYDMDGNTLTDFGGWPSTNAAEIDLVNDVAMGASAVALDTIWAGGTTSYTAGGIAARWMWRSTTGPTDSVMFQMGYTTDNGDNAWVFGNPTASPINGDTGGAFMLLAGDATNRLAVGASAIFLEPNAAATRATISFYLDGDTGLEIVENAAQIRMGSGWSLAGFDKTIIRWATAGENDNNGSVAFGSPNNTAHTSGYITTWSDNTPAAAGTTPRYRKGSLRWDGYWLSGASGRTVTSPLDGGYGVHGWLSTSTSNNQTGADCYIFSGIGTGDSAVKGDIFFQTPDAGASGNALQSLSTKATLFREGQLIADQIGAGGDVAGIAGSTSLTNVNPALGGGAAPTLGTIGGSGPATAAQNSWIKIYVGTTAMYIPVWA